MTIYTVTVYTEDDCIASEDFDDEQKAKWFAQDYEDEGMDVEIEEEEIEPDEKYGSPWDQMRSLGFRMSDFI